MFESTSLLVYTLFYIVVSACFVLNTTEFVSNGVTVENLFETVIDKEYNDFIMHHIKRTSYTIIVHSFLPFGWFATIMYPIPILLGCIRVVSEIKALYWSDPQFYNLLVYRLNGVFWCYCSRVKRNLYYLGTYIYYVRSIIIDAKSFQLQVLYYNGYPYQIV